MYHDGFYRIHQKKGIHTTQIVTCGLDTAKNIFHFHGLTCDGEVERKTLKRKELLTFFAKLDVCLVGMEACGGSHYWARELSKLGHRVRLISPQFVKPFVKGNKNDYNDAEAISEAVLRPTMRFVGIKSQAQQDVLMLHRVREGRVTLLVHGARSVLRHLKGKEDAHSLWLARVSGRRGHNKACGAQANKTARRVWALLSQATSYQVAA